MDYRALESRPVSGSVLVQAAVQPATEVPASVKSQSTHGRASRGDQFKYLRRRRSDWQAVVREALGEIDILAAAVESTAREVAQSPRRLEIWDDGLGAYRPVVPGDDDLLTRRVRKLYRDHTRITGPRFAERLWYALESVGELWAITLDEGPNKGFYLAQSTALAWSNDGKSAEWSRYGPHSASESKVKVPVSQIDRVFNPDVEYDLDAWSPFRSVVSAIEQFQLANDLIAASLGEKLYTAPILWIPDDEDGSAFDQYKAANEEMRAANRRDSRSLLGNTEITRAPFVMSSEEVPQYVTVGSDLNAELFNLTDRLTKQIARASGQPVTALLEGVGGASHWGSLIEARNHFTYEVGPRADILCDSLTSILLSPFLPENAVGLYRIGHDISKLVNAQVMPAEVRQAYMIGAVERRSVAESVGKEVWQLPDGVSEYTHWLTNHSSTVLQQDAVNLVDENEGMTEEVLSDISEEAGPQDSTPRSIAAALVDDSWIVSSAYR